MQNDRKVTVTANLPEDLVRRMEVCIASRFSGVSSKRELVETAVEKYLDSAELKIAKLEIVLLIVDEKMRKKGLL